MGTIKKITVLLICLFFSTMLLAGECEVKIKFIHLDQMEEHLLKAIISK